MSKWLELSVLVDAEAVEPVAALFQEHGHGGVAIEEDISPFSDREGYIVNTDHPVTIRTYLPANEPTTPSTRATIERGLYFVGRLRSVGPLQIKEIDEQDWAEAWKEHFHVIRLGRRIVIRPSWREHQPEPNDLVIDIDPGMAFGTGLHPTTRMCLIALEDLVTPGVEVLDVGTGSGILAIAAVRLGAARVAALDVDPVAVSAARSNIARNGLSDRIAVDEGTLSLPPTGPQRTYGLVVANIIARVIVDLAPALQQSLGPDGVLLASGIIDERLDEVQSALATTGLDDQQVMADGDWRSIIARHGKG